MLDKFIVLVEALQGDPWSPVIFVATYTLACFIYPANIFPIVGGILFGFWKGLFFNLLSALLGASGVFFVSKRLKWKALQDAIHRKNPRIHRAFARFGFGGLLAARLLGFPPFVILNYLSGMTNISWRDYLAASFLGLLPWTALFTYSAYTLWGILKTAGLTGFRKALAENTWPLLVIGVLAVIGALLVAYVRRKRPKVVEEGNQEGR